LFGGASAEIDLVDVSGAEAEEGGKVRVERLRGKGTARVSVGDDAWILKGDLDSQGQLKVSVLDESTLEPRRRFVVDTATLVEKGGSETVQVWGGAVGPRQCYAFKVPPKTSGSGEGGAAVGASAVRAPMPGKVIRLMVAAGDQVEAGQPVLILEAMKMEHVVVAGRSGVVEEVAQGVAEGSIVGDGDLLVSLEQAKEEIIAA